MNTSNNAKRRASKEKIERVFVEMIQMKELHKISVRDICEQANINRSTFYNNYLDVYDLADQIRNQLEVDVFDLYKQEKQGKYNNNDFLKLFQHIRENPYFYKTYFKLGFDKDYQIIEYDVGQATKFYDNKHIEYHNNFFRAGLNAIIQLWLANDCMETPEEMFDIIKSEYALKVMDEQER